jgi:hypothetical protein
MLPLPKINNSEHKGQTAEKGLSLFVDAESGKGYNGSGALRQAAAPMVHLRR